MRQNRQIVSILGLSPLFCTNGENWVLMMSEHLYLVLVFYV